MADTVGRRASYLLGTITLSATTLLYVLLWQMEAPFWQWAVVSLLLGLGFTFFSGAVEAWLVDGGFVAGRAPALQAGGRLFDPGTAHRVRHRPSYRGQRRSRGEISACCRWLCTCRARLG